jgi:hypothetical protein
VTPNDANDPDSGPNEVMNYPLITSTAWVAGLLEVRGCFDGAPAEANYTVELFCNGVADVDPTNHGEGRSYAASVVLTGDIGTTTYGNPPTCTTPGVMGSFLPGPGCVFVASTATNNAGNTSEFGTNAVALSCTLSPQTATNQLPGDTSHTVTALVQRGSTLIAGALVDFTVSGVNAVTGPDPLTDGAGQASFAYTSNGTPGNDTITATVTDAGETATCIGVGGGAAVDKAWVSQMPVQLVGFSARRVDRPVELSWQTVSEIKTAGFRVWREAADGRLAPVGPALVPARGEPLAGATYRLTDWTAPRSAARYWLEDLDSLGQATRHGPAAVGPAPRRVIRLPGPGVDPLQHDPPAAGRGQEVPR